MKNALDKEGLHSTLLEVGDKLHKQVTVLLFGGGSMVFRNQKPETKDVDLLFEDAEYCKAFTTALEEMGFSEETRIEKPYQEMHADGGIWKSSQGARFDLFVKKVCNALEISEAIKARSELLGSYKKLQVRSMANEDVILFKGITDRPRDTDDIAAVTRSAKINWQTILKECRNQSSSRALYASLLYKLEELKELHGIDIPITRELKKLDELALLKEAYARRREKGLLHSQAITELKKHGATDSELRQAGIEEKITK